MVGKQGASGATLLVLAERMTREEIIRKTPDRTQASVKRELDKLERRHRKRFLQKFKAITVDNGSEFVNSLELEASARDLGGKRIKVFYAHPYSSWERGSNENANKLVRRFIPKGTDINNYSVEEIRRIEH